MIEKPSDSRRDGGDDDKDGKKNDPPQRTPKHYVLPEGEKKLPLWRMFCPFETLRLNASLEEFPPPVFLSAWSLRFIEVPDENPNFRSVDGVLYTKDGKTLLLYPPKREEHEFRIPDSVEVIAPSAFTENEKLERVIFSNSVREIGPSAFSQCGNLRDVQLPDSLLSIGKGAFTLCCSLTKIRIPKLIRRLDGCFDRWLALERIDVDPENPYFRGNCGILFSKDLSRLIYCPHAWPRSSLVIPEQVTTIEAGAFDFCGKILFVKIPPTVRVIGDGVFDADFGPKIYAEKGSAAWRYAKKNRMKVADIKRFPEEDLFMDELFD